eukprot:6494634-Pyramimonas_sp.AAC.1
MLTDAGYDRRRDVQMLGVEMDAAREGPTSRPMDWGKSLAEVVLKGVGASEVDGDTDSSRAESEAQRLHVIPTTRPLLIRAVDGDSLRIISPCCRNV